MASSLLIKDPEHQPHGLERLYPKPPPLEPFVPFFLASSATHVWRHSCNGIDTKFEYGLFVKYGRIKEKQSTPGAPKDLMPRKRISENDLVMSVAAPPRRKPASPRRAKHSAPPAEQPLQPAGTAAVCEPSPDEIARLAYSYWAARGYAGGSSEEDWLRAERELRGN